MTVRIWPRNMEKPETKYWGEVIGEWMQLRQNTKHHGDVGEADDQGKSVWGKKHGKTKG